MISYPDGITPNSGLTGPKNTIYRKRERYLSIIVIIVESGLVYPGSNPP